jgi:phosphoribosyl 1,2-cyclic phosphate phosphodiesterase
MRSSLYIKGRAGERVVIDTGPEFRLQAIRARIRRLDAVLLTHAHADHVHGLDDVRPLCSRAAIPVYGNAHTIEEMSERFSYVFKNTQKGGGKPRIVPLVASAPIGIGGLSFTPIPVKHGMLDILGWEIREDGESVLYLTDTSSIPSIETIRPPRVCIIGGLRVRPHETHFTFEQAIKAGILVKAQSIYLTHICHDYAHREIEDYCLRFQEEAGYCGRYVGPGYDGLCIDL